MKLSLALAAATISATAFATDICLPGTHNTWVHSYHDKEVEYDHRVREYKEGDHVHIWMDDSIKMSLVHVHEDGDHDKEPAKGILIDYGRGLRWEWAWNGHEARDCMLEKYHEEMEPICISQNANLTHTFNLGEDFKVDGYRHHVHDHEKGVDMDIDTLVENGTTNKPVEQKVMGFRKEYHEHEEEHWFHHMQWMDFSEAKIDPKTFALPKDCPE